MMIILLLLFSIFSLRINMFSFLLYIFHIWPPYVVSRYPRPSILVSLSAKVPRAFSQPTQQFFLLIYLEHALIR